MTPPKPPTPATAMPDAQALHIPLQLDAVVSRAEQSCRYVLKHQNFAPQSTAGYSAGFSDACAVCEAAIRPHIARHPEDFHALIVASVNGYAALKESNKWLECHNDELIAALKRALVAIDAGFGKPQRDHIKAQGERALAAATTRT